MRLIFKKQLGHLSQYFPLKKHLSHQGETVPPEVIYIGRVMLGADKNKHVMKSAGKNGKTFKKVFLILELLLQDIKSKEHSRFRLEFFAKWHEIWQFYS